MIEEEILRVGQLLNFVRLLGLEKSRTTSYHPMGNGLAKSFNSTLLSMSGTLEPTQTQNWKSHIGSLVHAYNCTKHDTTGFSPYYLMLRCHPRIPLDLVVGKVEEKDTTSVDQYVTSLQNQLKKAFEVVDLLLDGSVGNDMEANDSESNVYPELDLQSDFSGGEKVVDEKIDEDEEGIDEDEVLALETTSEWSGNEEVTETKETERRKVFRVRSRLLSQPVGDPAA